MAMNKRAILLLVFPLLFSSCALKKAGPAALQISSSPKSTVLLDGKEVGKTPYYDEKLQPLEYTLKLVPEDSKLVTWESKIKLNPEVLTVVNRELGIASETSTGEILALEKISQKDISEVSIVTTPNLTNVKFDKQDQGQSPVLVKNVTPSDHEIQVSLPGYIDRTVKVRTVAGYRLNASIQLAALTTTINLPSPTTSMTSSPSATNSSKATNKTPSPQPSASPLNSPSPSKTSTPTSTPGVVTDPNKVLILDTPTGWLRVRETPGGAEIGKVNPGEKYPYISEQAPDWVKIEYQTGKQGWVSSQYVKKIKE